MERPSYKQAPITIRIGSPRIDTTKKVKLDKKIESAKPEDCVKESEFSRKTSEPVESRESSIYRTKCVRVNQDADKTMEV